MHVVLPQSCTQMIQCHEKVPSNFKEYQICGTFKLSYIGYQYGNIFVTGQKAFRSREKLCKALSIFVSVVRGLLLLFGSHWLAN